MFFEFIKFIFYTVLIVLISKYILVTTLRKLAENLNLKPTTVGDVAGIATSVPELLTVIVSSLNGLAVTSMVNILSSNIINLIQYLCTIYLNKNQRQFSNKAIKTDIILVIITILIPISIVALNLKINFSIVPLFIIMYVFFKFLNKNVHKLYLKKEDLMLKNKIEKEGKWERGNINKTVKYSFYLIICAIILFVIGNLLGDTLHNLCNLFNISESIIGVFLGVVTSIPELITFFESQRYYKDNKDERMLGVVEATNNLLTSNIMNLFIIESIGIILSI